VLAAAKGRLELAVKRWISYPSTVKVSKPYGFGLGLWSRDQQTTGHTPP